MNCASCGAAMTALTLEGHLGTEVQLDVCSTCQVIWFDHLENLRLSPGGTLELFKVIGDRSQMSPQPLKEPMHCPRCDLRLLLTQDRQRNTPFRYWRCPREHGRIETFFDFLREKDFIRPLSPQQLAELRENVRTINCSNCGAPIDLVHASLCTHCGTPISMLDVKQIAQLSGELRPSGEGAEPAAGGKPGEKPGGQPAPAAAETLHPAAVQALFEALRTHETWDRSTALGLVEAGLWMVSKGLK